MNYIKNKKLLEKIKLEIDAMVIDGREEHISYNSDGTVTITYSDSITFNDIKYIFNIDWTGFENEEDGGNWSEPYNIEVTYE